MTTSTMGMARPGRELTLTATSWDALAVVENVLAARGFTHRKDHKDGSWTVSRGRTGAGIAVEAVADVIPLWLVPGARKHLASFGVHVRVLASTESSCTLRIDLHRKAAALAVDSSFVTVLDAIHSSLTDAGMDPSRGDLTDAALDRPR